MFAAIDPSTHPYAALGLTRNPDGSITRAAEAPITPPSCNLTEPTDPVLSKDVPSTHPSTPPSASSSPNSPRLLHQTSTHNIRPRRWIRYPTCRLHNFPQFMHHRRLRDPALVVSVDYRLAPNTASPPPTTTAWRPYTGLKPLTTSGSPNVLDKIKDLGWRVIVTGCDGDSTVDRQMELAKALKEHGVKVVGKFIEGEYHGYDLLEPSKSELILGTVQEMVKSPNK
ncbi:hypothetical protein DH2020_046584 [Rehmannia glutinosa]|uniref:Alpha/beta hydrolase fold-3 domain-containing protein n=1 Tax=Rehmannia glutinosa TaxID=99300 RepID=A0ABR0UBH6_REHGL